MDNNRYEHWGVVTEMDDDSVQDSTTPLGHEDTFEEELIVPTVTSTSSLDGYYLALQQRALSRSRLNNGAPPTRQPSSRSLHALTEEGHDGRLRRNLSTRSHGSRGRSVSHSKVASLVPPPQPTISVGQLDTPTTGHQALTRPHPMLRTRSSHPAQNLQYNDIRASVSPPARKTADNTPLSSPGLFIPSALRQTETRSGNSQLHHLQTPRETHTVAIEHDVYSGNKFINNYEIMGELGRGEHGKVKLGRDVERDTYVAIKIVPRYSAKRRLGKLGAPEDRTKREVAILKKARHPHVVSLLEVIDDPSKNKVYLILEYVDRGEIEWRKHGVREVCKINSRRFEDQKKGAQMSLVPAQLDTFTVRQAMHRREQAIRLRDRAVAHIPHWSLEHGGETDEESEMLEMSRSVSRQMTNTSTPSRSGSQDEFFDNAMASSMQSGYYPDFYHNRKFSIAMSAVSHMSSEVDFDREDDQHSYVPALTIEEARRAFRDTLLGLEFLHFIGIIHRDIKPANLLSSSAGGFKISDFGVSYLGRSTTEDEADNKMSEKDAVALDDEKELARSVGTPAFWAPEVCYEDLSTFADGKEPKITGALDLWALGITLYCMIYARLPFYNENNVGLHESVCTHDVFCPPTRLVPVDTTSSDFLTHSPHPIPSNKRLDYELKYEYVPEHVRDLIGRLLTKDPARRITIAEAKRHPWVVEGISDQAEWLHSPEVESEGNKEKILDVNERELSHAVGKRNIIERTLNSVSRIAGSLLGRNKDSSKRSSSLANSAGSSSESLNSPATSSTSTVGKVDKGKEVRRTSLKGEDVAQILKATREAPEHPLAQSQTASPDTAEPASYFEILKPGSANASSHNEQDKRPRGPDRAASVLSTAESVKTIKASQFHSTLLSDNVEINSGTPTRARVDGLWEGTNKGLNRSYSRNQGPRSRSRTSSDNNGHAGPSIAVSNSYASGAIQTPDVLRAVDFEPRKATQQLFQTQASAEQEFENAQQINNRRHIEETRLRNDIEAAQALTEQGAGACPPSPDDEFYMRSSTSSAPISPPDTGMQTAASASTIASSIDHFEDSSLSGPDYGMNSGASSPPEGFISAEYKPVPGRLHNAFASDNEPEFMRTADTITVHGKLQPAEATGDSLEEQYAHGEDGDDEDDSDEEGIVMGGLRR